MSIEQPNPPPRVLFVDDDPHILAALGRSLRSLRHSWDMTFCEGGPAGLTALDEQHFDVLVTDMQMPDCDGTALLRHAKEHQPHMVRIVLSGHTELATTLEVVNSAHQFLSKPTEGEQLREAIQRAARLHGLVRDERVRALVGGVDVLPTPPAVYLELTEALANPDVSIGALTSIVERDASLSAKIMQLISSPFFGIGRRITNLEQAVSYLGISTLKGLALSVGAVRCLMPNEEVPGFHPSQEQDVALSATRLVRDLLPRGPEADCASFATLLHYLGKLVLAMRAPQAFAEALQLSEEQQRPLWEVERQCLGYTHGEVGAYLIALWGLPYPIAEAVAHYCDPASSGAETFDHLAATHVALSLAQQVHRGLDHPPWDEAFLSGLGMQSEMARWRALGAALREAS